MLAVDQVRFVSSQAVQSQGMKAVEKVLEGLYQTNQPAGIHQNVVCLQKLALPSPWCTALSLAVFSALSPGVWLVPACLEQTQENCRPETC